MDLHYEDILYMWTLSNSPCYNNFRLVKTCQVGILKKTWV